MRKSNGISSSLLNRTNGKGENLQNLNFEQDWVENPSIAVIVEFSDE